MSVCLLSTAYFPPIQWFQKLRRYDTCLVERYDSYAKQTYRNRCVIATTNGTQSLTVPIVRYEGDKCLMRDIRISSHGNWQRLHLNALRSAYGESPFFDYYIDDLLPFFNEPDTFLYDHNFKIVEKLCELLDIDCNIAPTEQFEPPTTAKKPPLITPIGGEDTCVDDQENTSLQTEEKPSESERAYLASQKSLFSKSKEPISPSERAYFATPKSLFQNATANTLVVNGTETADFRDVIRPKKPLPDPEFEPPRYYQVYALKNGFQPNMSILDLLFNEGPEAVRYLGSRM